MPPLLKMLVLVPELFIVPDELPAKYGPMMVLLSQVEAAIFMPYPPLAVIEPATITFPSEVAVSLIPSDVLLAKSGLEIKLESQPETNSIPCPPLPLASMAKELLLTVVPLKPSEALPVLDEAKKVIVFILFNVHPCPPLPEEASDLISPSPQFVNS